MEIQTFIISDDDYQKLLEKLSNYNYDHEEVPIETAQELCERALKYWIRYGNDWDVAEYD